MEQLELLALQVIRKRGRHRRGTRKKLKRETSEAECMRQLELIFEAIRKRGRPKGAKREPDKNDYTWADHEIRTLLEGLLYETYDVADGRVGEAQRKVVLSWVNEPLRPYSNPWPFSFQSVCEQLGYDPEIMQDMIRARAIIPTKAKRSAERRSA